MTAITEAAVKKYWVVIAISASLVFGGAAWATKIAADVDGLKGAVVEMRQEFKGTAREIRLLREAMIRAGTALPDTKED